MARPHEFDRQGALDAAMKLFWCQGYSASSMQQLLATMDISRSSFYGSFGDKQRLYALCLQQFYQRTRSSLQQIDTCDGPLSVVCEFFDTTLFRVPARRRERGCMMVNTVLELAQVTPVLNQMASDQLAEIEAEFTRVFEQAAATGYRYGVAPARMAGFVMLLNQGLRVASRRPMSAVQLRQMLDDSLCILAQSIRSPATGEVQDDIGAAELH